MRDVALENMKHEKRTYIPLAFRASFDSQRPICSKFMVIPILHSEAMAFTALVLQSP
jgi:hypothetical protein